MGGLVVAISGDTAAGENQPGWLFNRDISTSTPFEFSNAAASIGSGSLYVLPISSAPADKFIGEFFMLSPIADVTSISYDFRIGSGGDTGDNDGYVTAINERRRLLAPASEGGGGLAQAVRAAGIEVEVEAVRQLSRMYGNSLIDLLALANISVLNGQAGTRKFESAAKVLRDRPEEVDLRIETDGPRTGMWSVVQPQWVTRVRRAC